MTENKKTTTATTTTATTETNKKQEEKTMKTTTKTAPDFAAIVKTTRNEKFPIRPTDIDPAAATDKDAKKAAAAVVKVWADNVENLRIVTSAAAIVDRRNKGDFAAAENAFFDAYKKVLAHFTNKAKGQKLAAQHSDFDAIKAIICTTRKSGKDTDKEFLPNGQRKFRKDLEIFIADRLTAATYKTAEQIEKERQERNAKNKAARKAAKAAEKAAAKTGKKAK